MAKLIDTKATLRRLRNRYRLVVMNDDTYEEVATFKLTRLSVYIALSSVFVVLVGLTVALIVFTPLKYYIPGYGDQAERRQMINMKIRADSLEQQIRFKEAYWENVKKVLSGDIPNKVDTSTLDLPNLEKSTD
jgi:predicted membrane-bound spermidine synthase